MYWKTTIATHAAQCNQTLIHSSGVERGTKWQIVSDTPKSWNIFYRAVVFINFYKRDSIKVILSV